MVVIFDGRSRTQRIDADGPAPAHIERHRQHEGWDMKKRTLRYGKRFPNHAPEAIYRPSRQGGACRHQGRSAQLAKQFDVHPNQITSWKAHLECEAAANVFGPGGNGAPQLPAIDVKSLHAKIGELMLENDFWKGRSAEQVC